MFVTVSFQRLNIKNTIEDVVWFTLAWPPYCGESKSPEGEEGEEVLGAMWYLRGEGDWVVGFPPYTPEPVAGDD